MGRYHINIRKIPQQVKHFTPLSTRRGGGGEAYEQRICILRNRGNHRTGGFTGAVDQGTQARK